MRKHFGHLFVLTWFVWTSMTDANRERRTTKVEPDLNCDFESGLSPWKKTSRSGGLKWRIRNRNSYHPTYGPDRDHTSGSIYGYFLTGLTSALRASGESVARLSSPLIITDEKTCLSFWYFTTGHQLSSIRVYRAEDRGALTKLLSIDGPQGSRWYRAVVNSGSGMFNLYIEVRSREKRNPGDIAIDDITFSYQDCPENESYLLKDMPRMECDFEDDLCSWSTDVLQEIHWYRKTMTSHTQYRNDLPPRSDGTSIMAIEGYRPRSSAKADLRGPTVSVNGSEACMSFWYKLEGEMDSMLFVKKVDHRYEANSKGQTLFSDIEKTDQWIPAFVTLPEGDGYHIAITGYSRGIIAVDDIRMTRGGPCRKVNQEKLVNCDFEIDFCQWHMKTMMYEEDWLRAQGPTPTNSTGPSQDHTTGDGHYIFLDASKTEVARLYSSLFNVPSTGACFSFWYYMHGADVYRLQLAYQTYSGDEEVIWSVEGSQGEKWIQQNVSLNSKQDSYLIFIAERNYFPRGDIALDDISISLVARCVNDNQVSKPAPIREVSDETTAPTTTFATTFRTEPTPVMNPQLIAVGEINPAFNNSRVELRCQHPRNDTWITWFKRDRNRYRYSHRPLRTNHRYRKTLIFEEIQIEDDGVYSCALATYGGLFSDPSNEVELRVVPDPRPKLLLELNVDGLEIRRTEVDLVVDSILKLTCGRAVEGGVYHWKTTSSAFVDSPLPNSQVLTFNRTRREHTGVYSCQISKDGFMTSKSNKFNIIIKPGRRCENDYQCDGIDYADCYENRCRCAANAVVHGIVCKRRPVRPTIITSPVFQEFAKGESFYLICKAEAPVPSSLTYSFIQNAKSAVESLRIMKVTNASEEDRGEYTCFVTHDTIRSYLSNSIYVEVKDFVNLNCDFSNGFCGWFQQDDVNLTKFVITTAPKPDAESASEQSTPYIQLAASNSKVPNRAMLLSPSIERTSLESCLTFWYRMHGPDVYSLTVWQRSKDFNSEEEYTGTELWAAIGESGSDWLKQSVTVGKKRHFHIAFEAIGQVYIDDIVFTYRGGC